MKTFDNFNSIINELEDKVKHSLEETFILKDKISSIEKNISQKPNNETQSKDKF